MAATVAAVAVFRRSDRSLSCSFASSLFCLEELASSGFRRDFWSWSVPVALIGGVQARVGA